MGAADFERVSSQTPGNRGAARQGPGLPVSDDMEYGVPDVSRAWRNVQNRTNSVAPREDENPVRHSSVPTHLQPKDIRAQSSAARNDSRNRRPSF